MIWGLLLTFIGFFLGLKWSSSVPYFYVLWITIFPFLIDQILPFKVIDNLYEMRTYASFYILIMLIHELISTKTAFQTFIKENSNILICLLILFLYFLVLSYLRNVGLNYIIYLRRNISHILLFFYLTLKAPTAKSISRFVIITLVFQIFIGLLQENNFLHFSFNSQSSGVVQFLTGAMTGNNLYANYLSVIATIILMEYSSNRLDYNLMEKVTVFILVIISGFLIFNSGIRTSLLSFIIGSGIVFFRNNKKLGITFLVFGIIIFLFPKYFNALLSLRENASYDWTVTSNSERQSGLLGIFNGWEYLQYSTIAYSFILITEYFIFSPIWGAGLYFKTNGYGGVVSSLTANQTDVTAALYVTEFGIIGVLFLILLFQNILNKYKEQIGENFSNIQLLIIVILIQSLTDSGIFDIPIMSYFFLYYFYLKQKNNPLYELDNFRHSSLQKRLYEKI